jgi:hypothetical protein
LSAELDAVEHYIAEQCRHERGHSGEERPCDKREQGEPQWRRLSPVCANRSERGETECADVAR